MSDVGTICKGISGAVSFVSGGFRAAQWRGDIITDIHDATGFSSAGDEENETGIQRGSFSIAGFLTKGATGCGKPGNGNYLLTADEGCTIAFSGNVGRWSPDVNVNDNGKCALDVRATGAITIVWDIGT